MTGYLNSFDREKVIFRDRQRIIVNIERLGKILEGGRRVAIEITARIPFKIRTPIHFIDRTIFQLL